MFFSVGSSVVLAGIVSVHLQACDLWRVQKLQLKVKMCCSKCEEKVIEEIREVRGVFDARAERFASKVVVVEAPQGLNDQDVLKKARKADKKAKFVELDAKEKKAQNEDEKRLKGHTAEMAKLYTWNPPPLMPQFYGGPGPYYVPQPEACYTGDFFNPMLRLREEEEKEEKKKKMQEVAAAVPFVWTPSGSQWKGPYYAPQPYPYRPEELQDYRLSEWYVPRYHYPPVTFQPERDEFHQPFYYYK